MATPPDELPLLCEALETADAAYGSRIQADGSDMRASQPGWRRLLGKTFHALASLWVVGPVQDTQCGFKGFHRDVARDVFARQQVTSIVFDVELVFLVRRRGYSYRVVPIRWADRRGSRMHPGLGLAIRVAWDLFRIPVIHRDVKRLKGAGVGLPRPGGRLTGVSRGDDAPMSEGAAWRLVPPFAIGLMVLLVAATVAVAGNTLGYDFLAYHAAAERVLSGQPAYDTSFQAAGGFGLFYYPPTFIPLVLPFGLLPGDDRRGGVDRPAARGVRGRRRDPAGAHERALARAPARRAVVAVPVRDQARPGRPAAVPPVRDRLALAGHAAGGPRRVGGPRGGDQAPAGADPRVGAAHPALDRGRGRCGRAGHPRAARDAPLRVRGRGRTSCSSSAGSRTRSRRPTT